MTQHFDYLRATRARLLDAVEGLSLEELNYVPEGFNNNIIWNMGHIVVTFNNLTYKLSGLDGHIDQDFTRQYQKGSAPDQGRKVDSTEVVYIKDCLSQLVDRTEKDYKTGVFNSYRDYKTSFGVILRCIEDAILFNQVHEGLHLGYIMAMKKAVRT